jgi:putative ubiquitin-RnfH superfamily antitoxin RatB of RatAB toxin-antitoxin module
VRVEVVYALPLKQDVVSLDVAAGATVGQALAASGMLVRHPDIDLRVARLGVWGRSTTLDALLREGDRVEIYRPLQVDPKEVRRRRAARKRVIGDP